MKLVRYGKPGKEKPGLIDDEGCVRSLRRELTSWMVLRAFGEAAELTGFGKRRFWQAA